MKFALPFIVFVLFVFSAQAQNNETIYLWPGDVPGETGAKHEPVQTADTSGNIIRLTDVTNPAMIVFEPEESVKNGAAVIVCPGGGYRILAMDLEGTEVAEWLSKLGYTAFVLQYRVPGKQQEALYDMERAMRIVRSQAASRGIDPSKIGVLGFSAGGSVAARVSTRYNVDDYPQVDETDTISCRPDFAVLIYGAYFSKGPGKTLTPELLVDNNPPPMFLFGTADDNAGHSSLVLADALRGSKVPVELHFMPQGGHGYGLRKGNPAAEIWPVFAEDWMKRFVLED
nr:alpha/beta hydrolase [uncultured Draconibacterium sp.]